MNKRTKKTISLNDALARARKYCALNERTREMVSRKLQEYGVLEGDIQTLLEKLTAEGFLNERRFAKAFAGGKFRMKKWGRNRIKTEMMKKGLPKELVSLGLAELNEQDYTKTLDTLLAKKKEALKRKGLGKMQMLASLLRYALQKGFEQNVAMDRIRKLGFDEPE